MILEIPKLNKENHWLNKEKWLKNIDWGKIYQREFGQSVIREGSAPGQYIIHNLGGNTICNPHSRWVTS